MKVMRTLFWLSALLMIISGLKAQEKEAGIYLLKSGHVEYELSGNITGTRSIWWDNYGEWSYEEEKTVTKMKIFGMSSEEEKHIITVTKDGTFWTANMTENTGMTGKEPTEDIRGDLSEMDEEEQEEYGRQMFEAMGGRELPPETFMGRKCNVMEVMGSKTYIYKNIPLKSTVNLMGIKADAVAVKLEENISVPASKFQPVAGIDYEEMPDEYGFYD